MARPPLRILLDDRLPDVDLRGCGAIEVEVRLECTATDLGVGLGDMGPIVTAVDVEAVHEVADVNGGGDEVIDLQWAGNLFSADAVQAAADGAAALRAVWGAAEHAGFDAATQVR